MFCRCYTRVTNFNIPFIPPIHSRIRFAGLLIYEKLGNGVMDYTERQVLGGNDLQHKQDSDRFIPAGQRSEVLAERRVEEDRRIAQACSDVYEEPTNSERREDRKSVV